MPNANGRRPLQNAALHLFFVLDTSGSMTGSRITMLNRAMRETINALKRDVQDKHADANLYVSVLEFNTNCHWVTKNGPEELITDFVFEDMKAGGLTYTGAALMELDKKMSRNEYFEGIQAGCFMPVVVFMTDGGSNDDLEAGLNQIKQNKWFSEATKIGFAIGDDANVDEVIKIIGEPEALIKVNTHEEGYEEKFIRNVAYVAVRASLINSDGSSRTHGEAQQKMNETIADIDPSQTVRRNQKPQPLGTVNNQNNTEPSWPKEEDYD